MRVITGIAKGIRLETMEGLDVRPTTDKVKELYFHQFSLNYIIQMFWIYLPAAGQLGIER